MYIISQHLDGAQCDIVSLAGRDHFLVVPGINIRQKKFLLASLDGFHKNALKRTTVEPHFSEHPWDQDVHGKQTWENVWDLPKPFI